MLFAVITTREWFLIIICAVIFSTLFVVTFLNSRRKLLQMDSRLKTVRQMQQDQLAKSMQSIEANRQKVAELQELIRKLGDENTMLKLELEEKKATLDYSNTIAEIEQEKRSKADSIIFSSEIYIKLQNMIGQGQNMNNEDIAQLDHVVNSVYTDFTSRLFGLYKMNSHEYTVSLLVKARFAPKDIAILTAHSKESIATTRSRLYYKVFRQKGATKDWDDFIFSL